jgi:hypothetical protein
MHPDQPTQNINLKLRFPYKRRKEKKFFSLLFVFVLFIMGNQSSQEKQSKTDATHIRLLLDYLTTAEKDHLLKQFGGNTSSFKSINVGAFTKRCKDDLPDYFDGPLAHSLGLYVGSHCSPTLPTMLTLRQCLDSVISITHGTTLSDGTTINTADAFVQLYILAAKEHNMSLEAFVTGMVGTGVQLWFEGSGTKFVDDTAQCSRLVNTILHFAKERQRTTDQMDWLLDDDQDVSKHNIGGDDMGWTQQVTAQPFGHLTDDTTKQTLVSWFETSSELGILFRLVAKTYFFGRSDLQGERLHQARISHGQCPSLGSAAGALSFSRLLSPYDYFYLCMQLPQNALSWSSHERIQRRQPADQDLQHRNIFSSRQNGNSWQVFANGIVRNQGATLLVIKTKDGSLFGGYADDPWRLETDWYGTSTNYLFQLDGSFSPHNMMGLWNATSNNRHYQYLCWGKKSLPNGLGKRKSRRDGRLTNSMLYRHGWTTRLCRALD